MNVKAPYLSLDEARNVIATEGACWEGSDHQALANREGWNIFNLHLPNRPGEPTEAGIERYDSPEDYEGCAITTPWSSDEAVIENLQQRIIAARDHTGTYAMALRIEHALNSLRYHLWGEDYVDSRCGPDRADCPSCGRADMIPGKCEATDDCPSYFEERGIAHPEHA